ncbi:PqiC family protein, partial [Burkholderia sp. Ac-20345]|uniref:PqiC family protein n=1 Tax=Burkholderia sp. Ac-20345 TaxID=2703891 RepID=UPI001F11F046
MTTRVNGFASGAAAAVAALALAACSSPPARFYTLSPADAAAPLRTAPANPAFLIEVPSVGVPEQVAKNQLVVQKNAAQVDVLEQERWASPPADEIRRALSEDLAAQLGTIDVANSATPPGVPVYRISVNVQRFESWPSWPCCSTWRRKPASTRSRCSTVPASRRPPSRTRSRSRRRC